MLDERLLTENVTVSKNKMFALFNSTLLTMSFIRIMQTVYNLYKSLWTLLLKERS